MNKKASVLIYVLFLVNIAIVLGVVVFNSSFTIQNNLEFEQRDKNLSQRSDNDTSLAIETLKEYNSNGGGFTDNISCPTNVTMSGTTNIETGIESQMVYSSGSVYCSADYNGDEVKIFYNKQLGDYDYASYLGELIPLYSYSGSAFTYSTTNLANAAGTSYTGTPGFPLYSETNLYDGNKSIGTGIGSYTYYSNSFSPPVPLPPDPPIIDCDGNSELEFTFNSDRHIGFVDIVNNNYNSQVRGFISGADINFYDSSNNLLDTESLGDASGVTQISRNFRYDNLINNTRRLTLTTNPNTNCILLNEIEIFEVTTSGTGTIWAAFPYFTDSDDTLLSFTSEGTTGGDGYDDDFNSDDYLAGNIGFETLNIAPSAELNSSPTGWGTSTGALVNGNKSTSNPDDYEFHSLDEGGAFIEFIFDTPKIIRDLIVFNRVGSCCDQRFGGSIISLYDNDDNLLYSHLVGDTNGIPEILVDFEALGELHQAKRIYIAGNPTEYLNLREIEIFGDVISQKPYAKGFGDDDVYPRKTAIGNVLAGDENKNIFWSNSETSKIIQDNSNNDDNINQRIGNTSSGVLSLDIFTTTDGPFNIEISELNKQSYSDFKETVVEKKNYGFFLDTSSGGFIHETSSGAIYLSDTKDGNQKIFDFQNKDYAIFLSNEGTRNFTYRLSGFDENTGSGLYLVPFDDSSDSEIKYLSNRLIIGDNSEYIGKSELIKVKK